MLLISAAKKFSCSLKYVLGPLHVKVIGHKSMYFTLQCEIMIAHARVAWKPIASHLTRRYHRNVCNNLPRGSPPLDARPSQSTAPHDHTRCITDALDLAETVCAKRGARLTPLRRRVLELVWNSHRPVGAYAILDDLRDGDKAAAPPTVYRALDFLMEQGLIHRIESLNAFVGCDHPEDRHVSQFLICTLCSAAVEIDDRGIANAVKKSAADAGFTVSRFTVELQGTCPACAKAA
jgi:Fur family transcriptional regulator, zinc uptake regulator